MLKEKVAKAISIIFSPQVWLPVLLVTILLKSGLTAEQLRTLFPVLFIFQIAVPVAAVFIGVRLKIITAWDIPNKEERYFFFLIIFASYAISGILIYFLGNQLLLHLILILLALILLLATYTYCFGKISLHTAINTVAVLLVNFLFEWSLPLLYLLVPIVYWARFVLKKHSLGQLGAGVLVGGLGLLGGLAHYNYISF